MIEKLPPIRQKITSKKLVNPKKNSSPVYFSPYVSVQDVSEKETKKVLKSALKTPTPVQYDSWVQTANEKDKEVVMKALNNINQNEITKPRLRSPPPPPSTSNTTADILVIESNSTPVSDKEVTVMVHQTNVTQTPVYQTPPLPQQPTTPPQQQTVKNEPHWMVYKQENIPDYIIEAKKRLGQIKQPHIAPIPTNTKHKQEVQPSTPAPQTPNNNDFESGSKSKESFESNSETKKGFNKHWLQWENPTTPDYIKAIRHRLRDDRYKKIDLSKKYIEINRSKSDLDNNQNENQNKAKLTRSKSSVSVLSKTALEKQIESSLAVNTCQITSNNNDQSNTINTKTNDTNKINRSNSNLALVGTAGGGYFNENSTTNDTSFYNILPAEERVSSSQSNNAFTYEKPPRSGSKMSFDSNHYYINDNSQQSVPIQQWMQNAEEKDREDVLKVLKSLDLSRPGSRQNSEQIIKNFVRIKSQNSNTPNCSSYRKSPAPQVRKLGTTRNLYKFPTEKNEKVFIKEHLWNPNSSTNMYGYNI